MIGNMIIKNYYHHKYQRIEDKLMEMMSDEILMEEVKEQSGITYDEMVHVLALVRLQKETYESH